jgi:hypothetical protein
MLQTTCFFKDYGDAKANFFDFSKLLLKPWDLSRLIELEIWVSMAGWILLYDPKAAFTSRVQVDNVISAPISF